MSTQLQWSPDAKFELSGIEIEALITKLSQELNTPTAQDIIRTYELSKALQQKVQNGLTTGIVKEVSTEEV